VLAKSLIFKAASALAALAVGAGAVGTVALADDQPPVGEAAPEDVGIRARAAVALVRRVAEASDPTPQQVLEELDAGKTLAEIAAENGADPDAIAAEFLAGLQARLDEAVAEGHITQERADEIMAAAPERVETAMNTPHENWPEVAQRWWRRFEVRRAVAQRVMEASGLTPDEVVAELQAGKTLAEIATENGADPDAIEEELLADLQARLDEAVAEGHITQEQADKIMAAASERLHTFMTTPHPNAGRHRRGEPEGDAGA
jgi:polyhydroxyalkanoate synthesis regulator phasin